MEELNAFYTNYVQKLVDNDESLLLLLHSTRSLFAKYFLLNIFKKILSTLPLDIWLLNQARLSWDSLAGDITGSFVSFNFILFLEILKNLNFRKYLFELIDFLVFFAEENLVFKFDFDIFVKTSEFVFFKILALSEPHRGPALESILKLFTVYAIKAFPQVSRISKREVRLFQAFCWQLLLFVCEHILFDVVEAENGSEGEQVKTLKSQMGLILQALKLLSALLGNLKEFDEAKLLLKEGKGAGVFGFDLVRFLELLKTLFDGGSKQVNMFELILFDFENIDLLYPIG